MGYRSRRMAMVWGLLLTWLALGLAPRAQAADYPDMSTAELKALLDSGQPCLLVNPLSDLEYNEGYIPGSVNVPLHTLSTSTVLPEDKNIPVVTYCLGRK